MYCRRMNFLSSSDKSELNPAEKSSVVQDFGIGYIMIELTSLGVASTSSGDAGLSTLNSISSTDQLFGGPESSRITASRFQWIPAMGFWCSWIRPSACPNSCSTTLRKSSSDEFASIQPKFIVGLSCATLWHVVPTVDHEPSPV